MEELVWDSTKYRSKPKAVVFCSHTEATSTLADCIDEQRCWETPGMVRMQKLLGTNTPLQIVVDALLVISQLSRLNRLYYEAIAKAGVLGLLKPLISHAHEHVRARTCNLIGKPLSPLRLLLCRYKVSSHRTASHRQMLGPGHLNAQVCMFLRLGMQGFTTRWGRCAWCVQKCCEGIKVMNHQSWNRSHLHDRRISVWDFLQAVGPIIWFSKVHTRF